jgi:peptidoglycan/xylan/chitin deacetylase (PgdA/CDA1 family)
MTVNGIDILMFHSISDGSGPTCISPEVFRRQMQILAECGYRGMALAELPSWLLGESRASGKPVILTFDDGFTDFAQVAFPEIQGRGWTATLFLPAAKVGGVADWNGRSQQPAANLISWATAAELAKKGVEIGAHGVTHTDLTTLPPDAACQEVADSRRQLEDRIGRFVISFAAPYGRTNLAACMAIRTHYQISVGTRLARARPTSGLHQLPRIEMFYFRDFRRWRDYLEGKARGYFLLRQLMRGARGLVG